MDEILYLEPDEEITSVVDKLKGLEADSVGLVAPKGSSIVQSLVSLKLLQKQAQKLGKEISIITSDEVGQNLAGRINLPVYADVRSKKPIEPIEQKEPEETGPIEITDEPATATMAEIAAEKSDAEISKKEQETKPEPEPVKEEYKDLPKSFEVHRYDEPKGGQDEEEAAPAQELVPQEKIEEPVKATEKVENKVGDMQVSHREAEPETPKFINRPLHERKVDDRMELESARPTIHESKQSMNPKKHSPKKTIFTVVGIVLFILAVALFDLAMAKLNIDVSIPADPITKDVEITAETNHPNVDLAKSVIGATQTDKELSQDGSFVSTGDKETGDPAKGTLTFLYSNDGSSQSIVAGTTVQSSSGIQFRLDSNITIPGATVSGGSIVEGKVTGSVTAVELGTAGNLPTTTQYKVTGKIGVTAQGATNGGTTKKVKVVTASDIDTAKKNLVSQATDKFKQDIKSDADTVFLDEAFTADTTSFTTSKNSGDVADNFTATAKVKVVALTFSKKDFTQAVVKAAENGLPEGKSLLVTDADQVTPSLIEAQLNVGQLKLKGELQSHLGPKINLDQMITGFKLKPIKEIRTEVEDIPGANVKDISVSPAYALPYGPIIKKNTHFNIEYTNK